MRAVQILFNCFVIVFFSCFFILGVNVGTVSRRDDMNRRGPYFNYLRNVALPVPRTTINSRRNFAGPDRNDHHGEHIPVSFKYNK